MPGDPTSAVLPRISTEPVGEFGSGDKRVQAYCFRMCLTDHPDNRIPFAKPEGYDEQWYELLLRNYEAGERGLPWINSSMPNRKTDTNNRLGFSTDFIGQNYDYPEASYERRRDFEDPDHLKELRDRRRRARDATWLLRFYALSPQAEYYYQQLSARNLQPRVHINKIVALADIHGPEKVALALQDAIECQAFSSQYIENILHQRARLCPPSGPLHLTHRTDLLDLDLNPVDLTPYDLP